MERQIWKRILEALKQLGKASAPRRCRFADAEIVRVVLWAALHDRPISWATQRENWPSYEGRRTLPSDSTISRRSRQPSFRSLLKRLEQQILSLRGVRPLVAVVDGKPLPISGCSKDRQAGYGRATGGKAKGYKLHVLLGLNGTLLEWRLTPMNKDERTMAKRMIRASGHQGYVLGDGNFDSNPLHAACAAGGDTQLVAPRRHGRGLGHHRHEPKRLRAIEMLEGPFPQFGRTLLALRDAVERFFGNLTNWGGALTCLPAWARTYRRVHRWVQAKLLINALKPRACAP